MRTDSAARFFDGVGDDAETIITVYEVAAGCAPPGSDPDALCGELFRTCGRLQKLDGAALASAYGAAAAAIGHIVGVLGTAEARRLVAAVGMALPSTRR